MPKAKSDRVEKDLIKTEHLIPVARTTNPIMIKSNVLFTRRTSIHSEDVFILISSAVSSGLQFAADRPKDFPETQYWRCTFLPLRLLFLLLLSFLFFLLRESECKGCRNEEGTSVHNSKTSSPSASARLFCLRLVTVVVLLCSSSFPLLSSQPEQGEEEFSEQVLGRRSFLSDITFILFSSLVAVWTMSLFEHPFIYESFCIIAIVSPACT